MQKILKFCYLICLGLLFVLTSCDGRYAFISQDQWDGPTVDGKDVVTPIYPPDYPQLDTNEGEIIRILNQNKDIITLAWKAAKGENLQYQVYQSTQENLIYKNIDQIEQGCDPVQILMTWKPLTDTKIEIDTTNFDPKQTYYFNVSVKNEEGKRILFKMISYIK